MQTTEPKTKSVKEDVWIKTPCPMCYNRCGAIVHRVNGVAIKIEGNPDCPQGRGRMCAKGNSAMMSLYNPYRVKVPLKRTNPEKGIGVDPKWVEISWEEALDTIAQKLKRIKEDDPRKVAMLCFDVDALSAFKHLFTWAFAFGTPNADDLGGANYLCGNGLHPTAYLLYGAFHEEPDVESCNYLILIGAQLGGGAGEDAMTMAQRMSDARVRGMKLVVVDPIYTNIAAKADEWLPIRPGTDAAFALALVNTLINELEIYDAESIKKDTNGPYLIGQDGHYLRDKATNKPLIWDAVEGKAKTFDSPDIKDFALEGRYEVNGTSGTPAFQLLKDHVRKYSCEEVSKITTIPAATLRRIAKEFGEAARIGSKIVIEGKELPYRPATIYYRRGPNQQRHAMLNCLAIQLLNIVIGGLDVPGGDVSCNATLLPNEHCSLSWMPRATEDGMMTPEMFVLPYSYPAREVKPPGTDIRGKYSLLEGRLSCLELFPVAVYSDAMIPIMLQNPERFKFPYKPELLLHEQASVITNTVDPEMIAENYLKKFSFMVSFALEIDETVEFADIVLPNAHYLETLIPTHNWQIENAGVGVGDWVFHLRQPVIEPLGKVRPWGEILFELADRAGFLRDVYHWVNTINNLKEPYKLDLDKKYSWEEMIDRYLKSTFGAEHDLAWFKEHGFLSWPKKVEETYPKAFTEWRIPVYVEHFLKAGEDVKRVTEEMGLDWDVDDYQPIPDWKPCPAYEDKSPDYDLYVVNFKLPFHTFSITANNVLLNEIGEYNPYAYNILINTQTARRKGIKDGDKISLETKAGKRVEGKVKVTEGIHPEVVGIAGVLGRWAKRMPIAKGKGIHWNSLIPLSLEGMDKVSAAVDTCIKVKVSKIEAV